MAWHDCFGTFAYGNGTKYVGEFRNDARNGKGIFTYPDGAKYEGDIVNNEKKGLGMFTWPNGAKYEGEFDEGTANGRGTECGPDGSKVRSGVGANGELAEEDTQQTANFGWWDRRERGAAAPSLTRCCCPIPSRWSESRRSVGFARPCMNHGGDTDVFCLLRLDRS